MAKAVVIKEYDGPIVTGYSPRQWQIFLHEHMRRFSVLVLHRRFGKSVLAINHMIDAALKCTLPSPQYAYIAPTYSQAERIVWKYLKKYTANIPGVVFNEQKLSCVFPHNKASIVLLGSENYDAIRGMYFDGVIFDETAQIAQLAWTEVVRPALSDRLGWCIFLGTPKGSNWFKDLYMYAISGKSENWFGKILTVEDTKLISEEELKEAKEIMDEDTFNQEFMCSFSSGIVGAYFARIIEDNRIKGKIGKFPYDPSLPVHTSWDLGMSDTTAIWFFQTRGGTKYFIDYYEVGGAGLPDIVRDLQAKKYVYGEHFLPHDANVRELSTGQTRKQVLYSLGLRKINVIPKVKSKRDSIDAARRLLAKCYFDEVNCAKGLVALENYKKEYNEKNKCFNDRPLHDWSSNGADAFQQAALSDNRKISERPVISGEEYNNQVDIEVETKYSMYAR